MDFISNNFVWFIVAGIIILMAIIGYIADKTDFGRKVNENAKEEKKDKKQKKEKKIKQKNEKDKTEVKENTELTKESETNKEKVKEVDKPIQTENENSKPDANELKITEPQKDNQINNENIDQSLFAPLTDNVSEVIPQTNEVAENTELKNVEPAKLEDDTKENNIQPVAEDEDIWKF